LEPSCFEMAGKWGRKIDAKLIPMLMKFHALPRLVVEMILDWVTQADLSGLASYLNVVKHCEEKASLLHSIAKVLQLKTCRPIDAKLIPMLMGFHGLPSLVVEMILHWVTQADLSGLACYLGSVDRCKEKVSLLDSIAKVSQLKTYELALPRVEPVMSTAGWGRSTIIHYIHPMTRKKVSPKNKRFVWAYKIPPQAQRSVGVRGIDNRPAWITRGKNADFLLVGSWGVPDLRYDDGSSKCSPGEWGKGCHWGKHCHSND
jgi:ABC-type transporter Mla MlaB component